MSHSADINYLYLRHYIESLPGSGQGLRILDYGCGQGEVVSLLRGAGFDCQGCDVNDGEGYTRDSPELQVLRKAGHIQAIEEEGPLPYPVGYFDVVLSNQVFEHVRDLGAVLARLRFVLKDDGHILAHFPSKEVLREGHIGIPLAHRFPRNSRLRYFYTLTLRRLGLGYFKRPGEDAAQWTERTLAWIDQHCCYLPMRTLRRIMSVEFTITHNEQPYMLFRAGTRSWLRWLLQVPGLAPVWCRLFRSLAFMAVVLRPIRPTS